MKSPNSLVLILILIFLYPSHTSAQFLNFHNQPDLTFFFVGETTISNPSQIHSGTITPENYIARYKMSIEDQLKTPIPYTSKLRKHLLLLYKALNVFHIPIILSAF